MTRLEELAEIVIEDCKWLDSPENQKFSAKVYTRDYLAERNDFMASKLTAEQAVIMQGAANEFDNAEVEPETAETEENARS